MSSSIPTDQEMYDAIRRAKFKLIEDMANGKGARRISFPNMTIEAQDSDKLLDKLDQLEQRFELRAAGRRGIVVRP